MLKNKTILLDTNFLMLSAQFNVDIYSEIERICNFNYKLFVLDKTIEELKNIIDLQKGKHKDAARVALQLLRLKKVGVIKTSSKKHTDDIILDYAKKDYLVATKDKDLKRKLINQYCSVIVLKQKKILDIVNNKGFM